MAQLGEQSASTFVPTVKQQYRTLCQRWTPPCFHHGKKQELHSVTDSVMACDGAVPDTDSWNGLSSVSTVVKNSTPERVRCQRNKQAKNTTAFTMHCVTELCQWLQHQNCLIGSFFSEVEVHKPYIAIS